MALKPRIGSTYNPREIGKRVTGDLRMMASPRVSGRKVLYYLFLEEVSIPPLLSFGIFALLCVWTLIVFRQFVPELRSELLGPPEDNMQDFWNTGYVSLAEKPDGFFFTNMIRFPEGTPLYYHSFAYPKVFAIAALTKAVGVSLPTLLLLQNISLLISFPLAGLGAFYLIRHLTNDIAGALIGSFVFAFNPSHVEHVMHHAGVSSIEFIPFFVLSYLLSIERKSLSWWGLAIVFYTLAALSCWYYLFYIAYFMLFHTAYVAIRDRALPKGWSLLSPIACSAGIIVVLTPLLIPMVRQAMGPIPVYGKDVSNVHVADVFGYVVFPPVHLLGSLTQGIYSQLTGNRWEQTVYLGLVSLIILVWRSFSANQSDRGLFTYTLCGMAVFGVLASGSYLHVLGNGTIPMPDALLSKLPFFKSVRVPSRAIVFTYLFLAIAIGHAVALAWQHSTRPLSRCVAAVIAALIVLDFYPAQLSFTPVSCSRGLAVIRDDPERGFGVLNLPSGGNENNAYMLQQICHGRPIAQGQTSRSLVVTLRDRLETLNLEAQRRQLTEAKIKYIVISHPIAGLFEWKNSQKDGQQVSYSRAYPIAYDASDITVLRVY
jgi:hypothetical protein